MTKKITASCANVFEDLGFPPDEAAAMLAREMLLIEKERRKRGKKQQDEKWFLEQVEIGLAQADDPATQWITQEQAGAMWEKQRAALSKRVEPGAS